MLCRFLELVQGSSRPFIIYKKIYVKSLRGFAVTGFEESETYIDQFNGLLQLGANFAAMTFIFTKIDLQKISVPFFFEIIRKNNQVGY